MFTRIVKMKFSKVYISTFISNFETIKEKIRSFNGCEYLELYQDKNDSTIFFTYSRWKDTQSLENYRNSELFKGIWSTTKPMFSEKAEAWSVDTLHTLD